LKLTPLLGCLVVLIIATGCADVRPTRANYLSDYSQLRTEKENRVEVRPPAAGDLANVESFHIEDVAWRATRTKKAATTPEKQAPVLKHLRDALRDELAKVRPVVDAPGPRTARVRAAVTDEVEADVIINILASIVAVPVTNGGATIEAEILAPGATASGGAGTGRQIAALNFARPGGFFDILGYYWPDDHAKQATHKAAKRLRELLETQNVTGAPR
jgi:hypothetical protein